MESRDSTDKYPIQVSFQELKQCKDMHLSEGSADGWMEKVLRTYWLSIAEEALNIPRFSALWALTEGDASGNNTRSLPQTLYSCHVVPCVCVCVCVHQMTGWTNLRGPFRSEGRLCILALNLSLHYTSRHTISLHSLPPNLHLVTWLGADRHCSSNLGLCQGSTPGLYCRDQPLVSLEC